VERRKKANARLYKTASRINGQLKKVPRRSPPGFKHSKSIVITIIKVDSN
jgi:hypothetical protein